MTRAKKSSGRVAETPEPAPQYVAPRRTMRVIFIYLVVALMVLSLAGGVIGLIIGS